MQERALAMRTLGLILLLGGFAWLSYSAAVFPARVINIISDAADERSLPRRDTYSLEDIDGVVSAVGNRIRSSTPWMFTPASMMLFGCLLLHRAAGRQSTKSVS